ncbi:nuclease-related domain-containing protein [Paraburkholderia madseniana]|uniref:nuclease-related domain-containing protein n=1 Tax=Paraburkholderia madseniana TaxID=2599607 RepID=UPI0015589E20|nr:nuclease-related domain-containing protein [Paraburkholderia madseniana]NPT66371.1 NERD domain-containing protein [Paraburkholderia madseniana]
MLIQTVFGLTAALFCAYLSLNDKRVPDDDPSKGRATSSRERGEEGERQVSAELRWHLARLCGDDWLVLDGLILIHAPGSTFPTAEIDHLAITPFGIFVIETKHWTGVVTHGRTDETLTLTTVDGQRLLRTSPIRQNAAKVRFLRDLLPPRLWIVEGLGVFSHEAALVAPTLPAALLERSELYRHLRIRQQQFARTGTGRLPIRTIADVILQHADTRPEALAEHRGRIQEARARGQG